MKSQVLHIVWCYISGEAAGEIILTLITLRIERVKYSVSLHDTSMGVVQWTSRISWHVLWSIFSPICILLADSMTCKNIQPYYTKKTFNNINLSHTLVHKPQLVWQQNQMVHIFLQFAWILGSIQCHQQRKTCVSSQKCTSFPTKPCSHPSGPCGTNAAWVWRWTYKRASHHQSCAFKISNIFTAMILYPSCQTLGYKPVQFFSKCLLELWHSCGVQMVIVIMTDAHCIDSRKLTNSAWGWTVPLHAREEGWPSIAV